MGFKVQPIEGDKWELVFMDEPSYIRALKMAPEAMEADLKSGIWLVVAFPVWSSPVRDSVRAAIACAKDHGGSFLVGVRPFDSHDEIRKWWPGSEVISTSDVSLEIREEPSRLEIHLSTDSTKNPIWLVLRDGRVIYQGVGPRTKDDLSQQIQAVLA